MKKSFVLVMLAGLLLFGGMVFAQGSAEPEAEEKEIVVGSKIDTEGALLGSMIKLLLEDNGFTVVDRIQTGTTPIVRNAVISGEIDIYPEYTGNGYYFHSGESQAEVWRDARSGWEKIRELDLEAHGIVWLDPAPANNTWAIAMREDLAESEGLETLEDLAGYINGGGRFKIAASEEFVSSEAALPSFEEAYGFSLDNSQMLILSGGNTTLTEKAAAAGQDGVNAAMAYGTDGQLAALGLVVLEDNQKVQPVYAPAPIVREEVFEQYPEIRDLLRPAFESLDLKTLQRLNSRIAVEGMNPEDTARTYLEQQGLLQ